jgi:glycosyltransferase involved in cell wall biosynthesis
MKVALVSEHASPLASLGGVDAGGQNVFVADLARALAMRGVDVTVYTRRDGAALRSRVAVGSRLDVVHVAAGPPEPIPKDELPPHMPAFARALRRHWTRQAPDVVHAHFWMSGMASIGAASGLDIPIAQTFHALGVVKRRQQGAGDTSPDGRVADELRIALAVDRVLATSTDEAFELARLGADRRRVSVVPPGVDLEVFRPDGPTLPRSSGLRRVAVVSRLVERKGIGDLVTALAGVPGCELVVAGGPERARLDGDLEYRRLRQLAEGAGVAARVRFLGSVPRDQVAALIRSSDVVACVPWYEPFGMTALEAMACGVPVLATAVGGLVDTVLDGVTGVHVPARRPDAIAHALRDLLARPRLMTAMGQAGAERARARYGWDAVAGRTLAAYSRIAEGRRGTRAAKEG